MFKSKKILAVLLICALLPLTASATVTRVIGLGGSDANYVIKDAFNPSLWPQLIKDYPNLAGGEFYSVAPGGFDFQKAYVNYDFGTENSVIQFSLDQLPGLRSTLDNSEVYSSAPNVVDENGADAAANKLSIIYGRPLGDMKFGLALAYAGHGSKATTPAGDDEISASVIGVQVGLSAIENKLDLAVGFESVSFEQTTGGTTVLENDGSMAFRILGRYWHEYSENTALVPNLEIGMMTDGAKDPSANNGDKTSATRIKLGVGHNWTPRENMLALFEIGIDMISPTRTVTTSGTEAEVKYTDHDLPYWRLGFETKVFNWLNGRFGAQREWVSWSSDVSGSEPSFGYSRTDLFLGATAHWNRMVLDVLVAPDFLHNGPYFVSGNTTGGMFSRVSLKYDFNE